MTAILHRVYSSSSILPLTFYRTPNRITIPTKRLSNWINKTSQTQFIPVQRSGQTTTGQVCNAFFPMDLVVTFNHIQYTKIPNKHLSYNTNNTAIPRQILPAQHSGRDKAGQICNTFTRVYYGPHLLPYGQSWQNTNQTFVVQHQQHCHSQTTLPTQCGRPRLEQSAQYPHPYPKGTSSSISIIEAIISEYQTNICYTTSTTLPSPHRHCPSNGQHRPRLDMSAIRPQGGIVRSAKWPLVPCPSITRRLSLCV